MKLRIPMIVFGSCAAVVVGALVWAWSPRSNSLYDDEEEQVVPILELGDIVAVGDYHLSGPYVHENLTLFLVHGRETLSAKDFLTLEEALRQQKAVVNETGSVSDLTIENQGDTEVFIQSGDIIKGGKQDRTLPYDSLIEAKSGQVPIDSFCVEQGRWSKRGEESSSSFSSSSYNLGTSDLKRSAHSRKSSSQSAVWRDVGQTQKKLSDKLGASAQADASATSLQLTLESPAVRRAVAPYLTLSSISDKHDDSIGYVAIVNGKVVSADIYASRALFRKLWPKLLDGSAVEAFIAAVPGRATEPILEVTVRAFLQEAEDGKVRGEALTQRTYVQVRDGERTILIESCDRSRSNLVLHRSFLARRADSGR